MWKREKKCGELYLFQVLKLGDQKPTMPTREQHQKKSSKTDFFL